MHLQNLVKLHQFVLKILSGNEIPTYIMGHNNPNLDLVISMHMQKLVKLHQFVLKILSGNKIPTYIKGHNTVINLQKSMCNNPNLDVFNINAFAKSGQISSTISQDTEWKRSRNHIIVNVNGHNSV